jgi:hypothetical protein
MMLLGPALIPAQERFNPATTLNPPFELAYWHWGLATAQRWRERMHLRRDLNWDEVLAKLSPLPASDGLYLAAENAADSYSHQLLMTAIAMACGGYDGCKIQNPGIPQNGTWQVSWEGLSPIERTIGLVKK